MTITEFLVARMDDEENARREEFVSVAETPAERSFLVERYDDSLRGACSRATFALKRLEIAALESMPYFLQVWASEYSDHPAYDQTWKP